MSKYLLNIAWLRYKNSLRLSVTNSNIGNNRSMNVPQYLAPLAGSLLFNIQIISSDVRISIITFTRTYNYIYIYRNNDMILTSRVIIEMKYDWSDTTSSISN